MTFNNLNEFNIWLHDYRPRLNIFYKDTIGHETVDFSRAMDHVAQEIRSGNEDAMDIGFDLLVLDPAMPFGKIIKSKILNSFAINHSFLNRRKIELLIRLHEKWSAIKPFPPREIRYLEKLLNRISKKT